MICKAVIEKLYMYFYGSIWYHWPGLQLPEMTSRKLETEISPLFVDRI